MNRRTLMTAILLIMISVFSAGTTLAETWVCKNCGSTQQAEANYCSVCGTAKTTMADYCQTCGRKFLEGENYCPNDGTSRGEILLNQDGMISQSNLPTLSTDYDGYSVKMKLFEGDRKEERRQSYAGPGKQYVGSGAYKPYKQRGITAYFIENNWVYVHLSYQTVEDRYLYLSKAAFSSLENVPAIDHLDSISGYTENMIVPSWGPGDEYGVFEGFTADKGITIKAFFQENGYVYAEYKCEKGLVRMWLPEDMIVLDY